MISRPPAPVEGPTSGVYLFCFVCPSLSLPPNTPGLTDGQALFTISHREVGALACEVDAADFTGATGETQLGDLVWVAPRACRHQAVVELASHSSSVLPARFASLFSSREKLMTFLKQYYEEISRFLEFVQGKEEWSVKGLLDRDLLIEALITETPGAAELPVPPGARYLKLQRLRGEAVGRVPGRLREWQELTEQALKGHAVDLRRLKPLSREASGRDREVVFNWAFLLARQSLDAFRQRFECWIDDICASGLDLELTGPWPPYSFAPPLEGDPSADCGAAKVEPAV
jgi:hypothetical protein